MNNNLDFFTSNIEFYSSDYRDFSLRPWEKRIVELVSGENVLDVACGGGRITIPLLHRGHNVTATDFVPEFEYKIRRHEKQFKGEFKFVRARIECLPLQDDSFDSVVCVNSIVYAAYYVWYRRAISEMVRVLKPGGKLYFTSWNALHPLWGSSILLNYVTRRRERFGEVTPFLSMDRRTRRGKVKMYVPSAGKIQRMCDSNEGLVSKVFTSDEFLLKKGLLSPFKPILVVAGVKK